MKTENEVAKVKKKSFIEFHLFSRFISGFISRISDIYFRDFFLVYAPYSRV